MTNELIKTIGVVGAGQMGRGIAQVAAMSDFIVNLYDVSNEALNFAKNFIDKQLRKGVEKKKWSEAAADAALKRISFSTSLQDFKNSDLVIEAATENPVIKFDLFRKLDECCKSDAILASNTSSISITEIAAQTKRPHKVIGMHFMNPVPVMELVEGIRGLETDDQTTEITSGVAQKMGKTFITVRDLPGFAVNRILMPMINEAIFALHEGIATTEDIDLAMKLGTNQPMGPLQLADFIGLDTCLSIMEVLHKGLGDPKYRPCPLLKQYVAAGRLGVKNKRGFYEY